MNFIYYVKKDKIGILTFNNEEKLNVIDNETLLELEDTLNMIDQAANIDCLIITGAGDKSFIAGGDIKVQSEFNVQQAYDWSTTGNSILSKLEKMSMPVICAVNGYALGGGMEVVLACDIVIASDAAVFGQPEVSLGITPGFGGTQRLPRKIGINKAKELIFTGKWIDAIEGERIGLVNKVVAHESLMEESISLCNQIISNSSTAIKYSKKAIDEGIQVDIERGLELEKGLFSNCFSNEDRENLMNGFLNKNS